MTDSFNPLTKLLEHSKQQLSQPFANKQRKLLVYVNYVYLFLVIVYLVSEKLSTGHFVPHFALGYVYLLAGVGNLFSLIYSNLVLQGVPKLYLGGVTVIISADSKLDIFTRWASILSIMFMSFLNMIGFGNPSNDSIMADFALGHSIIVLTAILISRKIAIVWSIIVVGVLVYTTFRLGYTYQFNYLTQAETARYEHAIEKGQSWALTRQQTLRQEGLNPPTVSRYVHEWAVFILIAFFTAHGFTGISLEMIRIIPNVTQDIANAIDKINQQELERQREKNYEEEQKMLLKQESLENELNFLKSQLNPHFLYNTLHYLYSKSLELSDDLAESILKLSDIMRYSLREGSDFVLIQEEITYVKDFIALHQLRHENNLYIDFTIGDGVYDKKIFPFILISLVENAFKHGKMNDINYPVKINVGFSDDYITFFMYNKKSKKSTVESTHIGLSNIQRRLELMYPSAHDFRIEQNEESFSCFLKIKV